ncbi:MAG: zf-HC2 domain-containing protein [Acidobacteriia bacterium]|nr:zf-HC2 domain-containing protein [Terriglobia bacterium]
MADAWTPKLDTYLDGELAGSEMQALDAHLRGCPACAADILNRVQLRRATQSAGRRYQPSGDFRQRVQQAVAPRRAWSPWRAWLSAATAVCVLVFAGLVVTYMGRAALERKQTFSEVADLHVATLASSTPVDVVSTDRHTVKPWFAGKIPFTFNLPELQNSDFTLVGGRVTYLGQAPGAHLIYQVRKHQMSVFIFQDRDIVRGLGSDSGPEKKLSFNLQTWRQDDLRYFVVGDASPEDIGKLVDLLKAAARS